MDEKYNMTNIFEKLNDLKHLFQYAQKIVPILQSLADFMNDTVPLMEQINHSIADSTSKIPKASNQINDVTNATELATTEILDLVDKISSKLNTIETEIKTVTEAESKRAEIITQLEKTVEGNTEALALIEKLKEDKVIESSINKVNLVFPEIMNDTYSITLSLQVQDITSQQLAAVNHLIQQVQHRLAAIIQDIDSSNISNDMNMVAPDVSTFDPNASYDKSSTRQDIADSLINNNNQKASQSNQKASQDEIDKLFL